MPAGELNVKTVNSVKEFSKGVSGLETSPTSDLEIQNEWQRKVTGSGGRRDRRDMYMASLSVRKAVYGAVILHFISADDCACVTYSAHGNKPGARAGNMERQRAGHRRKQAMIGEPQQAWRRVCTSAATRAVLRPRREQSTPSAAIVYGRKQGVCMGEV